MTKLKIQPHIREYLLDRFEGSRDRQTKKGVEFTLTFDDYLEMWSQRRINHITVIWENEGKAAFVKWMKSSSGYVLTWKNLKAKQLNHMGSTTAWVCARSTSKECCKMKTGGKHTLATREKQSKSQTGKKKAKETCNKTSESMKKMWAERKAKEQNK